MALIDLRWRTNRAERMPFLKKLFWLYFLLLIFEGGLRKWVLPQLSAPLLLVRDPVALLIVWEAYRTHKWPKQWASVIGLLAAGILLLCFIQLVAGDNPWFVALYGLRSYLLPFPVAFIMGENLSQEDLRKFGVCILWLLLPLTALEVAQYNATPSSILNAGASLGARQLDYAGGHVRASATFSYVTGPASYIPLAAAFIFYGIVDDKFAKKWLLYAASFALLLAIPVTGSRTLVVLLLGVLASVALAAMFGVSQLASALKAIVAMSIVAVLVSQLPVVSDATSTFQERLLNASGSEGSTEDTIVERVISPITDAIEDSVSAEHWFGVGIGYGSNAAAALVTGKQEFRAGEGEIGRVLIEFGPEFGFAFMIFRFILAIMILAKALARVREHQPLAWFLIPSLFPLLAFGTLEQPTIQGFIVITLAFSLTALKQVSVPAERVPVLTPRTSRAHYRLGTSVARPRDLKS
jgi:hypothetical protein